MNTYHLTESQIEAFLIALQRDEKSPATLEKYRRDIIGFHKTLTSGAVNKEAILILEGISYRPRICHS